MHAVGEHGALGAAIAIPEPWQAVSVDSDGMGVVLEPLKAWVQQQREHVSPIEDAELRAMLSRQWYDLKKLGITHVFLQLKTSDTSSDEVRVPPIAFFVKPVTTAMPNAFASTLSRTFGVQFQRVDNDILQEYRAAGSSALQSPLQELQVETRLYGYQQPAPYERNGAAVVAAFVAPGPAHAEARSDHLEVFEGVIERIVGTFRWVEQVPNSH